MSAENRHKRKGCHKDSQRNKYKSATVMSISHSERNVN
nr:MAG TPA: hypothetical protein [Caudoviricetes sp.]